MGKKQALVCPECSCRDLRYRPTLSNFICRRCGHVFKLKFRLAGPDSKKVRNR